MSETVSLSEATAAIRMTLPRIASRWAPNKGALKDLSEADVLGEVTELTFEGVIDQRDVTADEGLDLGDLSSYRIPAAAVQVVADRLLKAEIDRAHERAIAYDSHRSRLQAHLERLDADPWYDDQCRGLY